MRHFIGTAGALACAAAIATAAPNAKAQDIAGHMQLGLTANLFSYDTHRLSSGENHVGLTDATFGPGTSGLGFAFGFGLTRKWLVGAQLLGSSTRSGTDVSGSHDLRMSSYSVLPRVEYVFIPGESVAPYLGATLGVRGSLSSSGPATKISYTDFAFGAILGLHAYLAPAFSIDPNVALLASTGTERFGGADFDRSGFSVLFGVALSGWLDVRGASPQAKNARTTSAAGPSSKPVVIEADVDGTVHGELALANGRQLRLVGRPIHQGNEVLVTLIPEGHEATPLAPCTEVVANIDGSERALSNVRSVPGTRSSLEATIPPRLLRLLGLANYEANFAACGNKWELSPEAQAGILDFVERFREIAERYGTWPTSPPGADAARSKPGR